LFAGVLELASGFWPVVLFVALLLWPELKTRLGSVAEIPNKLLAESLLWRKADYLSSVLEAVKEMDLELWRSGRLGLRDRVRAHSRWSSRWIYGAGACSCGRWPAVAVLPSPLLAEGRPPLFLLAVLPNGRQFSFRSKAMATSHGSLVAPSGFVPGDGVVGFARRLWTRSLLCFQSRVLLAKSRGLLVKSSFVRVLFVKVYVSYRSE